MESAGFHGPGELPDGLVEGMSDGVAAARAGAGVVECFAVSEECYDVFDGAGVGARSRRATQPPRAATPASSSNVRATDPFTFAPTFRSPCSGS